jgi:very-short-patch-repair endonuclease
MTARSINDARVPRARQLRRMMTYAEQKLWRHLKAWPPATTHFRRQATIGSYFVDFACHTTRLVIEVDGGQHGTETVHRADLKRTQFLVSRGYRVLRFWNNEALENIEGVMHGITEALREIREKSPPPPTPPRRAARRGRGADRPSERQPERQPPPGTLPSE